jgi:hypothetical protein
VSAFYNSGIETIYAPIATYVGGFNVCKKLTRIDFGGEAKSKPSIQSSAFQNDTLLTTVIIRYAAEVVPLSATGAFTKTPIASGTGFVYVPDDLVDAYKSATNWLTFADQIKPLSELPE